MISNTRKQRTIVITSQEIINNNSSQITLFNFNTKSQLEPTHLPLLMNSRLSYKSMADYDYHRVIQQKKNLGQVQKVLTMYEHNNQSLVNQVYDLIKQNELLRKQSTTPRLAKSKLQPYKPNISVQEHNENSEINTTIRSTSKKHNNISISKIPLNHPRDVYLPAQEAHAMNIKRLRQARTAHKMYDSRRDFEEFKEKLSAKKEQLKKEYRKKTLLGDSVNLSLSRKVYIDRPQVETHEFSQRKPFIQVEKVQSATFNIMPSYSNSSHHYSKFQKRGNSPYNQFKTNTPLQSPSRSTKNWKQPPKYAQQSSSAIKIEQVYPENSIKIQQPKTKWGDLSSTYFQRSKWMQNDQNGIGVSEIFYEKVDGSKAGKTKRKKFLNLVSFSVLEQKLQQKCKV